jgi:hypothetical protein
VCVRIATLGHRSRVRLGRDYYVRVAGNDYSVDPTMIGRMVEINAGLEEVLVTADSRFGCLGVVVAAGRLLGLPAVSPGVRACSAAWEWSWRLATWLCAWHRRRHIR